MAKSAELLAAEEKARDIRFMGNPELWPAWPYCPVKRYVDNIMETGYLMEVGKITPTVYLGNIFNAKLDDKPIVYDSFRAISDDGWVVD